MKRKNIFIILAIAVIALLITIAFMYNATSNSPGKNATPSPAANTTPKTQTPTPASSPAASPIQTSQPAETGLEKYKTEAIKDFGITFQMPEEWQKISGYDNRYEGKSGFIQFTALSGYGLTLKEAVDLEVNHELKPFGDNPQTKNITIDSQEASIILPAVNTAKSDSNSQAAVLLRFPKPLTISSTPYYYLIAWCDVDHIDKLANEIKFIR